MKYLAGDVVQVVEHLPSKDKVRSLTPCTTKKKIAEVIRLVCSVTTLSLCFFFFLFFFF
jgi:hypothetical protein